MNIQRSSPIYRPIAKNKISRDVHGQKLETKLRGKQKPAQIMNETLHRLRHDDQERSEKRFSLPQYRDQKCFRRVAGTDVNPSITQVKIIYFERIGVIFNCEQMSRLVPVWMTFSINTNDVVFAIGRACFRPRRRKWGGATQYSFRTKHKVQMHLVWGQRRVNEWQKRESCEEKHHRFLQT